MLFFPKRLLTSIYFAQQVVSFSTFLSYPLKAVSMSGISYIDAKTAQLIDERLMKEQGFSLDQLMELAGKIYRRFILVLLILVIGYSVAHATHDVYVERYGQDNPKSLRKVLVYCGPGNNGGDGLVAARHLKHFGYFPSVVYPKPGKTAIFSNLIKQCVDMDIEMLNDIPSVDEMNNNYNMIIDGLFGFSFQGPIRSPFGEIIDNLKDTKTPVLSIDIPSGWDVNEGDSYQTGFTPDAVISLTLPKNCMKSYRKAHYLGGRFMPPKFAAELELSVPDYGYGPPQVE
jgi:NAD(P)H-hydrate epimerase